VAPCVDINGDSIDWPKWHTVGALIVEQIQCSWNKNCFPHKIDNSLDNSHRAAQDLDPQLSNPSNLFQDQSSFFLIPLRKMQHFHPKPAVGPNQTANLWMPPRFDVVHLNGPLPIQHSFPNHQLPPRSSQFLAIDAIDEMSYILS
jgi:hypothetical protein